MFTGLSIAGLVALILCYLVFKTTVGKIKENAENFLTNSSESVEHVSAGLIPSAKALKASMEADAMESIMESQKKIQKMNAELAARTEEEKKALEECRAFLASI